LNRIALTPVAREFSLRADLPRAPHEYRSVLAVDHWLSILPHQLCIKLALVKRQVFAQHVTLRGAHVRLAESFPVGA